MVSLAEEKSPPPTTISLSFFFFVSGAAAALVCFLFIQTGRKIERERERADSVSWPGIKPLPTRWRSRARFQRPAADAAAAAGFHISIFGGGLKRNPPQVKRHGPPGRLLRVWEVRSQFWCLASW